MEDVLARNECFAIGLMDRELFALSDGCQFGEDASRVIVPTTLSIVGTPSCGAAKSTQSKR